MDSFYDYIKMIKLFPGFTNIVKVVTTKEEILLYASNSMSFE